MRIKYYGPTSYPSDFPNPDDVLFSLQNDEIALIKEDRSGKYFILTKKLNDWTNLDRFTLDSDYYHSQNTIYNATSEQEIEDGVYVQLFTIKDSVRHDGKVLSMKDISLTLTDSLMGGIIKLFT